MELPPADQLLASAIHYLLQGGGTDGVEQETALVLLSCEATYGGEHLGPESDHFTVHLSGPRAAYDALYRSEWCTEDGFTYLAHPLQKTAKRAFDAVTPAGAACDDIAIRMQLADAAPDWRQELHQLAHGQRVHNQGRDILGRQTIEWQHLHFRSQAEVRMARALDAAGVLFLPNCKGRLNGDGDRRVSREADFVVCAHGKWGILEVDGSDFHPRAAEDHDRDRLFKQHGIRVVERFRAEDCYSDAPGMVKRFLTLLDRNG